MTPISTLLVANRGEIASRIIRTARRLDIKTVAVHSFADADAAFVREADEAVALPGNAPSDTYLRGDLLVEAALATGCDALHPGYGFLSERTEFAEACRDAGLVFVGPDPEVIARMGDKVQARALMADAGVPVLPGITIEDDLPDDLADRIDSDVGYPVLVKAAFGGGGRGMRIVDGPNDLVDAVSSARREALSAFGDGTVFLERFVTSPRHIEVQVFGDTHGNVVHLFERECSIQRRYQKIIEEAPSPAVGAELRDRLGQAAVTAAKALGYVGAGTVEFVLGAEGEFHFLEVNTRLQVEHGVTELVTGLDLVELQLLVAEGNPLPESALNPTMSGHAMEVRLYAEDVAGAYRPATGTITRFDVPDLDGVRVDSGIEAGSVVGIHYDPMIAKVLAHGAGRGHARRLLSRALSETRLHGVVTNRHLLVGVLREPEFASGHIDTGYLQRHDPAKLAASAEAPGALAIHALTAALAAQAGRRTTAPVLRAAPTGWRNVPNRPQTTTFVQDETEIEVTYVITGQRVRAQVASDDLGDVRLVSASPDAVVLVAGGIRRTYRVAWSDETVNVDSPLGSTTLVEAPRFPLPGHDAAPGSLLAPMPGTVVRVSASPGDEVEAGDVVVVLEAMKMEHSINAPTRGVIETLDVAVGDSVDQGDVLAVVEEV